MIDQGIAQSKTESLYTNNHLRDILLIISAIVCVALSVMEMPLGWPGFKDESYMAMSVRFYRDSPLAMLMFWIGNLWTGVFGEGYLQLRWLSWLVSMLAVTTASAYMWLVTRRWRWAAWMFVLSISMGLSGRFVIYNWDGGVYLFYVLAEVAFLSYLRCRHIRVLILAGVASVLMFFAKVTTVVALPVGLVLVWMYPPRIHDCEKILISRLLGIGLFLCVISVTAIIVTTIMCGSPNAYVAAFASENVITGHGPSDMWRWVELFKLAASYTPRIVPVFVAVCIGVWLSYVRVWWGYLAGILISVLFGTSVIWWGHNPGDVSEVGPVGMSAMLAMLLVVPLCNLCRGGCRIRLSPGVQVVLWGFFLLPAVGSDMWYFKFHAYYQLPVAAAVIVPVIWDCKRLRNVVMGMVVSLMACLMAMGVTRVYVIGYGAHHHGGYPKCEGINIGPVIYNELYIAQSLYNSAAHLGIADRLNIDGQRYMIQYMFQVAPVSNLHLFHLFDDEVDIESRRRVASKYDGWLFVYTPVNRIHNVVSMLETEGFEKVCVYPDKQMLLMLRPKYARQWRQWVNEGNSPIGYQE